MIMFLTTTRMEMQRKKKKKLWFIIQTNIDEDSEFSGYWLLFKMKS